MKVFFDSNVYVAEAILGRGAIRILEATVRGRWKVFCSEYLLQEVAEVLAEDFDFAARLASLTQRKILKRASLVRLKSRAIVASDPKDSPILQAALSCGAHYLVTNDRHLLELNPFEGLRIVSMARYHRILEEEGLLGA